MYEWMPEAMEQSQKVFQAFSLDWGFKMNEAATEEEISQCEAELALVLPPSYREFLLNHNGARLFRSSAKTQPSSSFWWADSGVVIFGTKALIQYRPLIRDYFLYDDDSSIEDYPSVLPIAYLGHIGTGDFCALNRDKLVDKEHPVLDCDHELAPSAWKKAPIASSVEAWLKKMFDCVIENRSRPEYWFESDIADGLLAESPDRGQY